MAPTDSIASEISRKLNLLQLLQPDEQPSRLCTHCTGMTVKALKEGYRHLENIWDLPSSAEKCDLCAMIMRHYVGSRTGSFHDDKEAFVEKLQWLHMSRKDSLAVEVRYPDAHGNLGISLSGPNKWQVFTNLRMFAELNSSYHPYPDGLPSGFRIPVRPNLKVLSVLIQEWMRDCCANHSECNFSNGSNQFPRLPTRVIDLEKFETGEMKLWEPGTFHGQYIALSHRWGGTTERVTKTTKANLGSRLRGFPVTDLSQTFLDAVEVTRSLGIKYLWIDSLCIVQDDEDDWNAESEKMGELYFNAFVTIAATRADNSMHGFLGPRNEIPIVKIGETSGDHFYVTIPRDYWTRIESIEHGPLNRRAWVVQERALSPRIIHFTEAQIYWECWCQYNSEDLDENAENRTKSKREVFPRILAPHCIRDSEANGRTPKEWWSMLEKYMNSELTLRSDKLHAIAGLVNRIACVTNVEFYKGVWADSVHRGLLWFAKEQNLETLREVDAPSWSWASRHGRMEILSPIDRQGFGGILDTDDFIADTSTELVGLSNEQCDVALKGCLFYLRPECKSSELRTDAWKPTTMMSDYTGQHFRSIYNKDGAEIGWIILDHGAGCELDLQRLGWTPVVIRRYYDTGKWRICETRYFILTRQFNEEHMRVGLGGLWDTSRSVSMLRSKVVETGRRLGGLWDTGRFGSIFGSEILRMRQGRVKIV